MAFKFVILSALLAVVSAGYIASAPTHYAGGVVAQVANPSVDAVAQTHQNVVRSFGGTVSQYSKSIQTPYSSVHKEDTRISNNVYTPSVAKTVTYAAPAVTKTYPTAHNVGAVYTTHSAPAHNVGTVYTTHSVPSVTKTVYNSPEDHHDHVYASPAPTAAVYAHATPAASVYSHATPAASVYTHAAPAASVYSHGVPAASAYSHPAPTAAVYSHPAPTAGVYTHAAAPTAAVYHHEVPSTATSTYNHGPAATTYSHNGQGVSAYGSSQTVHYSPAEMVSHMSFDGFGTHWGY